MMERFWKLMYRLRLQRSYENVDRLHYLKRLHTSKPAKDKWYFSHRDADQFDMDEVVIHSRFRGKSVFFHCNPNIHVERQIIKHGLYERHTLELIADFLEPNSRMIDVGANIGAVTIPLAKAFPDVTVHAFEPNPQALERLQRNIILNDATNITLHPVGVGAKPGNEQLYASSYIEMGNASFLRPFDAAQELKTASVKVETLDDCFGEREGGVAGRVNFIKIDVQGYERHVLDGASALIHRDRSCIVFEHQDENFSTVEEAKDAKQWLSSFFQDNGYAVLYLTRHDPSMMFPIRWERPLNGNLLALPKCYKTKTNF